MAQRHPLLFAAGSVVAAALILNAVVFLKSLLTLRMFPSLWGSSPLNLLVQYDGQQQVANSTNNLTTLAVTNTTRHDRNFITTQSGCHMAKWVFVGHNRLPIKDNVDNPPKRDVARFRAEDCISQPVDKRLNEANFDMVDSYDTVYVPLIKLGTFANQVLKNAKHNRTFVILSGQWKLIDDRDRYNQTIISLLLEHPSVLAFFCQNIDRHVPSNFLHHPKLHPWPYGMFEAPMRAEFRLRRWYKEIMEEYSHVQKTALFDLIYLDSKFPDGRVRLPNRVGIPSGESVSIREYLKIMARAERIFAPDGDRPECYRHYEAIGMGTLPITQLSAHAHRHLNGSVVFENKNWDVNNWNQTNLTSSLPRVNRELVFEDYWVGYAENIVGRKLQWGNLSYRPLPPPREDDKVSWRL